MGSSVPKLSELELNNAVRYFFVMIDGLRPEPLLQEWYLNLFSLRERSSWTINAIRLSPAFTLSCHLTVHHSVPASRHAVIMNTWLPMEIPIKRNVTGNISNTSSYFPYLTPILTGMVIGSTRSLSSRHPNLAIPWEMMVRRKEATAERNQISHDWSTIVPSNLIIYKE